MRILFSVAPLAGHVRSIAPLAVAARAAGHEVVVVGRPTIVAAVTARGLPSRAVGEALDVIAALRAALPAGSSVTETWGPADTDDHFVASARQSVRQSLEIVDELRDFARRWRPDVMVVDPLEFAARMVAAELDVPWVRHRWAADPYSGLFDSAALDFLAELRCDAGLDAAAVPAMIIDPCPPSLQFPAAPEARTVRYGHDNGAGPIPDWTLRTPARPTVCVCMGTEALALGGAPGFDNTLRALDDLDVDVIVAINPRDIDLVAAIPARFLVAEMVPLQYFTHQCVAMVHHGGAGCVLTATAAALPQLVLPVIGDQFANGDRIASVGAGLCVRDIADQRSLSAVRAAVTQVIDDASLHAGARRLGTELSLAPDVWTILAEMEKLIRARD